jgi:hypothetical protein
VYPTFLVDIFTRSESERRQQRDEAWRAWHRQPDALPLPDEPPRSKARRLPLSGVALGALAARLLAWSQLLRR